MVKSDPCHYQYWWQALLALPPSCSDSDVAYQRLARVFRDQTRPTKANPQTGRRGQEFTNPAHETHFTVALWENFVLFHPANWLPQVWTTAQLKTKIGPVQDCRWSYQWAEHGNSGAKHCDVALEYQDDRGRGMVVVEAKRPGKELSQKDHDPDYYLSISELAAFERRSLIYLVDDAARRKDEELIRQSPHDVGFVSWEQLAVIQLNCVESLDAVPPLKAFVAGSIYHMFLERGITPKVAPLSYLRDEPSAEDIVNKPYARPLGKDDWGRTLWRLP